MGMIRRLMRSIIRGQGAGDRGQLSGKASVGAVRAGMHQKAEHEYQHARMEAAAGPVPETVEDALDMPAAVESEIPPVEEEDDEIAADIAEGEAEIAADETILEEVADPEASEEESVTSVTEVPSEEETLGVRYQVSGVRDQFEVEYTDKIPVLDPVTGGTGSAPETDLLYDPGDGSVKEIQEPLPGMERLGVLPYMPGIEDPSANVPAGNEDQDLHIDFSAKR